MIDDLTPHAEVQRVLRVVLSKPDLELRRISTLDEIDGWDSAAQAEIVVALEASFDIRFDDDEMSDLVEIDGLMAAVHRHLSVHD